MFYFNNGFNRYPFFEKFPEVVIIDKDTLTVFDDNNINDFDAFEDVKIEKTKIGFCIGDPNKLPEKYIIVSPQLKDVALEFLKKLYPLTCCQLEVHTDIDYIIRIKISANRDTINALTEKALMKTDRDNIRFNIVINCSWDNEPELSIIAKQLDKLKPSTIYGLLKWVKGLPNLIEFTSELYSERIIDRNTARQIGFDFESAEEFVNSCQNKKKEIEEATKLLNKKFKEISNLAKTINKNYEFINTRFDNLKIIESFSEE